MVVKERLVQSNDIEQLVVKNLGLFALVFLILEV